MYVIEPMTQEDVEEVAAVERQCFTNPWPLSAYRRELKNPEQNYYIVLRDDPDAESEAEPYPETADALSLISVRPGSRKPRRFALWPLGKRGAASEPPPIIGFAGMWNLYDEAHVTTIGVLPETRGKGLGELLFMALMDESIRRRVSWVTLEVRISNHSAQALYRKYGFTIQGRRPRYYSDNNEDAYIMWSGSLKDPLYLQRLDELRRKLAHRLSFDESSHPST